MSNPLAFLVLLGFLTLVQVTFFPLPLGLLAILGWFLLKSPKYWWLYLLIFSTLLGVIANIPIWIVLLSTSASFYLFMGVRRILPANAASNIALIFASVLLWEISTLFFSRLVVL